MQQDQLQAEHTITPSDNGRQASERSPCCHKESAVAYLFPNFSEQELVEWQRHQLCVLQTASLALGFMDGRSVGSW
jgi:hypothetical protein